MNDKPTPRFAEILEYHLMLRIQNFVKFRVTNDTMLQVFLAIKEIVDEVFSKSSKNLSEASREWISQKYYENVKFSTSAIYSDNPDDWKHKAEKIYRPIELKNISLDEVRYMSKIFNETKFSSELEEEMSKR